jgi:hypothetical protein
MRTLEETDGEEGKGGEGRRRKGQWRERRVE